MKKTCQKIRHRIDSCRKMSYDMDNKVWDLKLIIECIIEKLEDDAVSNREETCEFDTNKYLSYLSQDIYHPMKNRGSAVWHDQQYYPT